MSSGRNVEYQTASNMALARTRNGSGSFGVLLRCYLRPSHLLPGRRVICGFSFTFERLGGKAVFALVTNLRDGRDINGSLDQKKNHLTGVLNRE